jgi:hypothetical protein
MNMVLAMGYQQMANASVAGELQDAATAHGRRLLAHAAAEEKPAGGSIVVGRHGHHTACSLACRCPQNLVCEC